MGSWSSGAEGWLLSAAAATCRGAKAPLHHIPVVFVAGFACGFCSGTGKIPFSPALKMDSLPSCFIDEAEHPLLAAAGEGSRALRRS